jgi:hypothetical protein
VKTPSGIYEHYKGGHYRVLFTVRDSTNGPNEGRMMVVYISLKLGKLHVRDEEQFHEVIRHGASMEGGSGQIVSIPPVVRFKLIREL